MDTRRLRANLLLLLAAAIWGFAFTAQRAGMEHVGPFTFNAVRFALGSLVLAPLALARARTRQCRSDPAGARPATGCDLRPASPHPAGPPVAGPPLAGGALLGGAALAGSVLCFGSSLQQVGIVHTTAGKAGFITGLYVVIVPLLGLCWGRRVDRLTWTGAVLAAAGMYLLSVRGILGIARGDLLVLAGAFFWAMHVHVIGWLSPRSEPIVLASLQFATVALLSAAVALVTEAPALRPVLRAAVPILYAGVMSVGVAFTLQVVAQRRTRPEHTAIILSLESAFAVLGGWLLLGETLSLRGLSGCGLMLAGMIVSQLGAERAGPEIAGDLRAGNRDGGGGATGTAP